MKFRCNACNFIGACEFESDFEDPPIQCPYGVRRKLDNTNDFSIDNSLWIVVKEDNKECLEKE